MCMRPAAIWAMEMTQPPTKDKSESEIARWTCGRTIAIGTEYELTSKHSLA